MDTTGKIGYELELDVNESLDALKAKYVDSVNELTHEVFLWLSQTLRVNEGDPSAILLGVTNKVAMAEAFRAQGHDVTVIEDCPQIVEELRAAGFEVVMPVHKYNEHLMAVGV